MHRLPPRLIGLALLAASGASTLAHRFVYEAARHGPAQTAEFGLGLLTFILASAGVLLLAHGGKLFEQDSAPGSFLQDSSTHHPMRLMEPIDADGRAYDTRRGAWSMKMRYASTASRTPDLPRAQGGPSSSQERRAIRIAPIRQ